jgi:hypothetical protein
MNACERPEEKRSKPDGGFTGLSLAQVSMIWTAYLLKEVPVGLLEVRCYLAAQELVQTRKTEQHVRREAFLAWKKGRSGPCPKPVEPHYHPEELCGLLGEPLETVSRAVAHLEKTGLLTFTESRISFAAGPQELQVPCTEPFYEMLRKLSPGGGWKRIVPVPRRILRVLAETGSRSLIATALGFVIRCCWYFANEKRYTFTGRCKSSWIARSFSISLASVKAMRAFLVSVEFLRVLETSQADMNEKGGLIVVNPEFGSAEQTPAAEDETQELKTEKPAEADELLVAVDPTWHRLSATDVSELAREMTPASELGFGQPPPKPEPILGHPPGSYKEDQKESSVRHENQNQVACPVSGKAAASAAGNQESWPAAKPPGSGLYFDQVGKGTGNAPETWARVHIGADDLRDTSKVLALYELACSAGVLTRSDHAELKFMGFVERARLRATGNPGGFLRRLVERDLETHITDDQWDAARKRLIAFRYGPLRGDSLPAPERPQSEMISAGPKPPPKVPAAGPPRRVLVSAETIRKAAEEKLNQRVAEFLSSRTEEERETLKAQALANADRFTLSQYKLRLREKNAEGATLYLKAMLQGWCEKLLSNPGVNPAGEGQGSLDH